MVMSADRNLEHADWIKQRWPDQATVWVILSIRSMSLEDLAELMNVPVMKHAPPEVMREVRARLAALEAK